jgi:hypothetical protein
MAAALDVEQLNEVLECPVCSVVPTSGPLKQCKNGHVVCSSCEPKLKNKCPVCRQPIDTRALQLEKMLDMMTIGTYNFLVYTKVDCSGKRLMVCWKIWGFWNLFLYKMLLKTLLKFHEAPHIVGQPYGVPHGIFQKSLTLFYTKVSFQILKFYNRPSVLFPSIQLYISSIFVWAKRCKGILM